VGHLGAVFRKLRFIEKQNGCAEHTYDVVLLSGAVPSSRDGPMDGSVGASNRDPQSLSRLASRSLSFLISFADYASLRSGPQRRGCARFAPRHEAVSLNRISPFCQKHSFSDPGRVPAARIWNSAIVM
jgi:hypothetical protein